MGFPEMTEAAFLRVNPVTRIVKYASMIPFITLFAARVSRQLA